MLTANLYIKNDSPECDQILKLCKTNKKFQELTDFKVCNVSKFDAYAETLKENKLFNKVPVLLIDNSFYTGIALFNLLVEMF